MNLPSKAVLEFCFLVFVSLLLHFVSSFPFLTYKQLARKEVFPIVAWLQISELQAVISQLSNVLDRSLFPGGVFRIKTQLQLHDS